MDTEWGVMYWLRNRHGSGFVRLHTTDCGYCPYDDNGELKPRADEWMVEANWQGPYATRDEALEAASVEARTAGVDILGCEAC